MQGPDQMDPSEVLQLPDANLDFMNIDALMNRDSASSHKPQKPLNPEDSSELQTKRAINQLVVGGQKVKKMKKDRTEGLSL